MFYIYKRIVGPGIVDLGSSINVKRIIISGYNRILVKLIVFDNLN